MDPITAIGLASAIVQFVDFSSTLVSGAREIYSSASGARTEHDEADLAIDRLRDLTRRLPRVVPPQTLTLGDRRLLTLKEGCEGVSDELARILEAGRAKTPGSKRSSLRASLRNIRNKDKFATLQSRLDRYRGEVFGVLQAMMSDDVSETKEYLESLFKAQPKYAESLRQDLARTRDSIIHSIEAESQANQNSQQSRAYAQQASLEQIQKDLTRLLEMTEVIPAQDAVLDMLWFDSITTRQRSVDPAHETTFRWLLCVEEFDESSSEDETEDHNWLLVLQRRQLKQEALKRRENREAFLDWLSIGSGVFYISGKAGAGKSTLMKFLSQEEKTRQQLQVWAERDGKRLILARFFFWNSGDQLQKSLEGLYRAILWDILRQCHDLISPAFPDTWSAAISKDRKNIRHHSSVHLELQDLHAALNRILTNSIFNKQYKLCLFIDGLDEFDGDYWKLSKAISSWAATDSIKFCVSSRPHNEFMTMFASDPSRHLQLHELTRLDIFKFVWSEFQGDERSAAIRTETSTYSRLIGHIVERADGIFLWVSLVTYEMLKAMGNHSSSAQLFERLNHIPKGLDGIFKRMLDVIDEPERKRAAQMLLVMKTDLDWQTQKPGRWISTQSMMDKIMDNPSMLDTVLSGGFEPQTTAIDWEHSYQATAVRLIARCNGLVEIAPPFDSKDSISTDLELQFVHRSVSDFLDQEPIRDELLRLAGGFCPWTALVHSMLAVLKFYDFGDCYTAYVINMILRFCGKAENSRLPPFAKEMGSLIQICRQLAEANEDGCLSFRIVAAARHTYGDVLESVRIPSDDIESLVIGQGIWHGCIDFLWDRIAQNKALLAPRPQGVNILLAAALQDLNMKTGNRWSVHARDDPTGLLVPRILSIDGSSVNAPSFSCWRTGTLPGDPYFPNPSWTTWTTFLFRLYYNISDCTSLTRTLNASWRFLGREDVPEEARNEAIPDAIDVFLEHGADESVCFVLFDMSKLRQTRGIQRLEELEISDLVFYATLPAVMESWGIPPGPQIRQRYNTRRLESVWNVARVFSFLKVVGSPRVTMQQLDAHDLTAGKFVVVKVAAFTQLQDIKHEDIMKALESFKSRWEDEEPDSTPACFIRF